MKLFTKIKNIFNSDKEKNLPPENFFRIIKNNKHEIDLDKLESIKRQTAQEIENFIKTNQFSSAERLMFHLKTFQHEHDAIDAGFKYYVFRDDIDEFICNVSQDVVKIIELENFERKIPEHLIPIVVKAQEYFDDLYVLFTDYTGREERKIEAEKRANDPIVFGTFHSKNNKIWNHRFYYICDWTDEYCDLTLDKFVSKMYTDTNKNVLYTTENYTIEQLQERLKAAKDDKDIRDKEKHADRIDAIKLSKKGFIVDVDHSNLISYTTDIVTDDE